MLGIDDDVTVAGMDAAADADAMAPSDAVDDASVALDAPAPAACPSNYLQRPSGAVYRLVTNRRTWIEAASDCADDQLVGGRHTHLLVIGSDTERLQLEALGANDGVWIGLSFRQGTLQWVTTEPAPVPVLLGGPWDTGEPDDRTECVLVRDDQARYAEDPCTIQHSYVCECDDFPNDPTRY